MGLRHRLPNSALIREFNALGNRPTQAQLDDVGKKFLTHCRGSSLVHVAHDRISDELQGMLRLLKNEQTSLESYSNLLDETCSRISAKNASSVEILGGIIKVLSLATGDTMEKGKVVVRELVERAQEMEHVKTELNSMSTSGLPTLIH